MYNAFRPKTAAQHKECENVKKIFFVFFVFLYTNKVFFKILNFQWQI